VRAAATRPGQARVAHFERISCRNADMDRRHTSWNLPAREHVNAALGREVHRERSSTQLFAPPHRCRTRSADPPRLPRRPRGAGPGFGAVSWTAGGCPAADLLADTSPRSVNFGGDATYPAAYYAYDATYLYFRFRMDGDPSGPFGFDQYSWTALMQVPSGNP